MLIKISKKLKYIIGIILLINFVIILSGKSFFYTALFKGYIFGNFTASLEDYKYFHETSEIISKNPIQWEKSKKFNSFEITSNLKNYLEENKSIAFIIIKSDSLVFERYWDIGSEKSLTNTFSVTKGIVTSLLGIAIKEGHIGDINEKIIKYLPELKREGESYNNQVTIKDLITMSSGLYWNENSFNPFGQLAESYLTNNNLNFTLNLNFYEKPGEQFRYLSGNTMLLALIIQRATKKKISSYTSDKLWTPLNSNYNALWSIDKDKSIEKGHCCFITNALDLARIGSLYLNKGVWKSEQILDKKFVHESLNNGIVNHYSYSWRKFDKEFKHTVFCLTGLLGQYLILIPELKLIAVRLGHFQKYDSLILPSDLKDYIIEIISSDEKNKN